MMYTSWKRGRRVLHAAARLFTLDIHPEAARYLREQRECGAIVAATGWIPMGESCGRTLPYYAVQRDAAMGTGSGD
jgi:hypothetical protein